MSTRSWYHPQWLTELSYLKKNVKRTHMLIEMQEPLAKPAVFRLLYDNVQWYKADYSAGDTVRISFAFPKNSGEGKAVLRLAGEEEVTLGFARYIYQDRRGATMLLEDAKKEKNSLVARAKIRNAIELLEKLDPNSEDMASAYTAMCFSLFFMKSRKHVVARRKHEALGFYEKALAVWERNGNTASLSGNLTNISVMYARVGDNDTAHLRAMRGLELTKSLTAEQLAADEEAVNAWTHAASRCLTVGLLDKAERIVRDGLKRFGKDSPKTAHLWNVRARVFAARADLARAKAEELLPPETCAL